MTLPAHEAMTLTITLRNKLILFSVIFWFILSGIGIFPSSFFFFLIVNLIL